MQTDVRIELELVRHAKACQDWAEAEAILRQAIARQPDCVAYYAELGEVLIEGEHLDEAHSVLEIARGLAPLDAGVLKRLGLVMHAKGDALLAEGYFLRALVQTPEDPDLLVTLGFLACTTFEHKLAHLYYRMAHRLAPDDLDANLGVALTAAYLRDWPTCQEAVEKVRSLDPTHPQIAELEQLRTEAGLEPGIPVTEGDFAAVLERILQVGYASDPHVSPAAIQTLVQGVTAYSSTRTTPPEAHQAFITLYCQTQGRSNDVLSMLQGAYQPGYDFPHARGVLGDLGAADLERIVAAVREDGYYQFPARLSDALCARLYHFALSHPAKPSPNRVGLPASAVYEPKNPLAEVYWFDHQATLDLPEVQDLMADHSILSVAQAYLGTEPVIDVQGMYWSTAARFRNDADWVNAKLFHFDMDRPKWLTFFFYLVDVGPDNGPYTFIRGSHRTGGQPRELLARGYTRIPDADILQHYRPDSIREMRGPRGTIFVADGRGFHKGKPLVSGHRLMFHINFCNTMFGGAYQTYHPSAFHSEPFERAVQAYPRLYAKYCAPNA